MHTRVNSNATLAMTIRDRRRERGITQKELADRCGVSHVSISKIESNITRPSLDTIIRIFRVLGLELVVRDATIPSSSAIEDIF